MQIKLRKGPIILGAWMRFNSNIGALYSFFENLTPQADQADKASFQKLAKEMAFIFEEDTETVEKDITRYAPAIDDLDIYPNFKKVDSIKAIINNLQDPEIQKEMLEWQQKHPHRSQRWIRAFSSALNNPPMSGVLIRRSMLVSLVTFLEIFLEDLHKNHYLFLGKPKPETQKCAERAVHGNWRVKTTKLKEIGLDLPALQKYLEEILEITQRRNLLVHNDGIVDDSYIKFIPSRYKLGDQLLVSTRYFQRAINVIYTLCFLLFYNQFEQHEENLQTLYNQLDEFVINSLEQKRFGVVLELTENLNSLSLPEHKQHILWVNRAIAYRELGNTQEMNSMIARLMEVDRDWQIDMSISMLRHDIPTLKRQIDQAPNDPNITRISSWPLFDPVKNEIWFRQAFIKKNKKALAPKTRRKKRAS